jgi:glycosyltransferase involved in cell wall biosynthesis
MEDNPTLAAEHAALRAAYDTLQDRLAREQRAHDRERTSHATTAAQLALLRAGPALAARDAASRDRTATRNSTASRLDGSLRAFLSRHPGLAARLRRFFVRHPRLRRLLRPARALEWLAATLQLPGRIAARLQRAPRPGPPAKPSPAEPSSTVSSSTMSGTFSSASAAALADPRFQLRPLLETATGPPRPHGGRRMVCITHVLPYPPRAGNEYRIARMLTWLSTQGWEVLLVVSPPAHQELAEHHVRQAAAEFSNLIVCRHDGLLLHHLSCEGVMLDRLDGRRPRSFASALGEGSARGDISEPTVDILRAFCPDILVELLLHLEEHFDPEVLLAEYVFMTRPFPLLRPTLRKVIDTIDVFSNKQRKVERYGIEDPFTLADSEEALLLKRADLLIAIQPDEAADLRQLASTLRVISVGVDFDIPDQVPAATNLPQPPAPVILLVASDNKMNVKGLKDFLRFAWPLVRREVPDAELRVVGSVGDSAEVSSPGIRILGRVDDVSAAYAGARVVINPVVAGTGLKIKTVEALCHFRPIVLWPSGVEGIDPQALKMCHVATDWFDFAHRVIRLALSDEKNGLVQERQELVRHFAPDCVYAPLAEALNTP